MDLNSLRLCRLCLKTSDDLVNIFDSFQGSTIASVLSQHFWFQVSKNDGFPECLCEICWIQTKTFHNFYKRVQWVHKDYTGNLYGAETVPCSGVIKSERSVSPEDATIELNPCDAILEPDLSIVKYEVTESSAEISDLLIKTENVCDFSDDFHSEQISDQSVSKVGDDKVMENEVPSSDIECPNGSEEDDLADNPQIFSLDVASDITNECTKEEEDAQIREYCDMRCKICTYPSLQFETLLQVRQHYRKTHKSVGYITCCGRKYHRRFRVLDHIKFHVNPNALRCEPCDKQFKDGNALKNHMIIHERRFTPYKCKVCGRQYVNKSALGLHERLKHGPEKEKTEIQCDKCKKKCTSVLALKSHIRYVHESTFAQICDICARVFKHKSTLQNHMKLLHSSTGPQKVQCHVCGTWLKHNAGLREHMKRHDEDNVSCTCPICKKVVKNKRLLFSHMKWVHRSKRSHKCTMCDKAFKTSINLKEHIAIHTGEDLYSCEYCDRKFKSLANKYKHRRTVHSAELRQKPTTNISTDTD